MKSIFIMGSVIVTLGLFVPSETCAQGTMFLSNLGEPSAGTIAVGADSWLAEPFSTGDNNGYRLDSIQLLMSAPVENPNGFSVSIHGPSRNEGPGRYLGSLSGVPPTFADVFTYSASNITLSPLSRYWLVITSGTQVANGSFSWNLASTSSYDSTGGWAIGSYDSSADGLVWTRSGNTPLQFAVYATAVPEPSSLLLLCGGGLFLAACLLRPGAKRGRK